MPKPLIQPTLTVNTLPLEPRIDPRPIPPYHEPFFRPPPRPPDETAVKDSRKDLQDLDMDRKIEFEENSPIRKVLFQRLMKGLTSHSFKNLLN